MKYNCVIFDCDGVLVDSESIAASVLVEMAKEIGVSISFKFAFDEFTGKSFNSILTYLKDKSNSKIPYEFEKQYREKSYAAFKANLQPIEGIHEALKIISLPYCVASSGPLEKIKLNLSKVDLLKFFSNDRIFSCYEINKWKPDPAIYIHAAKKMGFDPQECLVIEDSIPGIQAAISGGFDVLIYANEVKKKKFNLEGQTFFSKMSDLNEIIANKSSLI